MVLQQSWYRRFASEKQLEWTVLRFCVGSCIIRGNESCCWQQRVSIVLLTANKMCQVFCECSMRPFNTRIALRSKSGGVGLGNVEK
jgi:hypothetical protein